MKNKITFIIIAILIVSCNKPLKLKEHKFTAINPLSYTDVKYSGNDEVLVTTYDGSIYKIDNTGNKELVFKIEDEIYSLQYFKAKDLAYLATYKSGVVIVDFKQQKIIKQLPIKNNAWIVNLQLSENGRYLSGVDVKRNNYIWDVDQGYKEIDIAEKLPNNYVRHISNNGNAYFQTAGKYKVWNITQEKIIDEIIASGKLTDIDNDGNMTTLADNQFFFYDQEKKAITYAKKHPYLIYQEKNGDTLHDLFQLKLIDVKIVDNKVYSVGLDKSVRVWDKQTGNLSNEWVANNATISGFDVSSSNDEIVTVDLKGNIVFKNIK